MAISVISSASVTAAPALAGMTTSDGTSAGFADLLFSQLGLTLTAAGAQVASAAGNEKASTEKELPTESEAPSGDPALAFLMTNPTLPPPAPAKPATDAAGKDVAISADTGKASALPGQIAQSVSETLAQASNGKRTATAATTIQNTPPAGKNSTSQGNFAAALEQQVTDTGTTSPTLAGIATPPGTRNPAKNSASEAPGAAPLSPQPAPLNTQPAPADKPVSLAPATPPPVTTKLSASEKPLDMPTPAANIAADSPPPASAQENGVLPLGVGNQANKAETTAPVKNEVASPLHSNAWSHDFSNKVIWLAKNDQTQAQININPPQLGPIQITLNLSGDQASAVFTSPHAEVRQAIENSLPQLKEMLSSAGINLGQADVGANLAQQQRETPGQSTNGNRLAIENAILPGDGNAGDTKTSTPLQRGKGLVDLFA